MPTSPDSEPVTGSPEEVRHRCKAKMMNGLEEEIFASGTSHGINWACKFSTEFAFSRYNSEKIEKYVYVSWYFEWDELERVGVKGFVGNITFWLKKQFELTPITETFPVDLIRSGQWIERRINENKNIQTQFSNCTVQFEFCLQPLLTCPDAEPLLCPEMEDTVLKVGENRMKVNRKFLSFHSDFFERLFNSGLKETYEYEIEIKDVNFTEFKLLMGVFHPSLIIPSDNSIGGILFLAHRFMLPAVTRHIENALLVHTKISFNRLFLLADHYGLECLLEKCIRCISSDKHIKYVKSYSEFKELSGATKERLEHLVKTSEPAPLTPQNKPGMIHFERRFPASRGDFYTERDDRSNVKWKFEMFPRCGIANNFESYETFVYSKFTFDFTNLINEGFDGAEGFIEFFDFVGDSSAKKRILRQIKLSWNELDLASAEQVLEKKYRFEPFRCGTTFCSHGFRVFLYPLRGTRIPHVDFPKHSADATVRVEGHEFHVNKTVLSVNSKFFRDLFLRTDNLMRTFTVNRGTKEQFAFLLDYIGIEPKVVNEEDARKLIEAAIKFDVRGVVPLVENYFLSNPEMSFVSMMKTVVALRMVPFLEKCVKKFQENNLLATCVKESADWKGLPVHFRALVEKRNKPDNPTLRFVILYKYI